MDGAMRLYRDQSRKRSQLLYCPALAGISAIVSADFFAEYTDLLRLPKSTIHLPISIDRSYLRLPPKQELDFTGCPRFASVSWTLTWGSRNPLKIKLYRQLHLARSVSGGLGDLTEAGIIHGSVRPGEHRMIERISRLQANLNVHLFAQRELLRNRQVGSERPRRPNTPKGSRRVAQRIVGRTLEHAGISEVVIHPI